MQEWYKRIVYMRFDRNQSMAFQKNKQLMPEY